LAGTTLTAHPPPLQLLSAAVSAHSVKYCALVMFTLPDMHTTIGLTIAAGIE
jgi:hypothetical protein